MTVVADLESEPLGACGVPESAGREADAIDPAAEGVEQADEWWQEFGDPVLSELVEVALENDFTLQVAYERLREARASAGLAQAEQLPTVDARASGRQSDGSDEDRTTEVSLGLEASYGGSFISAGIFVSRGDLCGV